MIAGIGTWDIRNCKIRNKGCCCSPYFLVLALVTQIGFLPKNTCFSMEKVVKFLQYMEEFKSNIQNL